MDIKEAIYLAYGIANLEFDARIIFVSDQKMITHMLRFSRNLIRHTNRQNIFTHPNTSSDIIILSKADEISMFEGHLPKMPKALLVLIQDGEIKPEIKKALSRCYFTNKIILD